MNKPIKNRLLEVKLIRFSMQALRKSTRLRRAYFQRGDKARQFVRAVAGLRGFQYCKLTHRMEGGYVVFWSEKVA